MNAINNTSFLVSNSSLFNIRESVAKQEKVGR